MNNIKKVKNMDLIKENDFILIHTPKKKYFTQVKTGRSFSTYTGTLLLKDIINQPYGLKIDHHYILKPTLSDIVLHGLKRQTQVIYPKEAAYIVMKLNLCNGMKVFECGTGSGAMSLFISQAIGPDGLLYTYEREQSFLLNAKANVERFACFKNIKMSLQDISQGIEEKNFDAAILDFKESYQYIELMRSILKPGAPLGLILPTTNQISLALRQLELFFPDIEIIEIILRKYKCNADRLRPEDRMVGHTGYLVFAR